MSEIELTKAKLDEAQVVLEAMAKELECGNWFRIGFFDHDPNVDIDGNGINGSEVPGSSLYDAYINALHAKAGTEPPPF